MVDASTIDIIHKHGLEMCIQNAYQLSIPSLLQCMKNEIGNTAGTICFLVSYKVYSVYRLQLGELQPLIIRG